MERGRNVWFLIISPACALRSFSLSLSLSLSRVQIDFNVEEEKEAGRGRRRVAIANEARVTGEEYFFTQEHRAGGKVAPGSGGYGDEILQQFYGAS